MNRLTKWITLSMVLCSISLSQGQILGDDPSLSFEQRTQNLVKQMTLEEKISQMVNSAPAIERLGVPRYNWWNECLHGLARAGRATVFPQAIALAASFDEDLIHRIASAISDEARVFYAEASKRGNRGIYAGLTFYTPNINIFRDPRWGRGQETYGEDPYLTSRIGVAFVEGLQGDDDHYLKAAACAKHYAVHSGPEELRHVFDAEVSNQDLYETYLPAFKALVTEADVKSVMGAYNMINGESGCASERLMVEILRGDWGFDGFITSDCGGVKNIYDTHKNCETAEQAAAMAIKSTLNLECGNIYTKALKGAVEQGLVSEAEIDALLEQLFVTRFELGLFDEVLPFGDIPMDIADSPEHKALAYEAAAKSVVLLENKGGVLPLDSTKLKGLYVTGPNANNPDALIGNYYGVSDRFVTLLEGVVNRVPVGVSVQYKQGVMIDRPNVNPMDWASGTGNSADATIVCLGLTSILEGEEGEALASAQKGDMENNSLPKAQLDYLKKLRSKAKNKPLIVVVTGGCPVELGEISEIADALIYAWYPGEQGGNAVADIIFGNVNPSGCSPLTFVKSVEDLPPFTDYSMQGRTYKYMTKEELYPFGYGLSYSRFEYSDLQFQETIKAGDELRVTVSITNSSTVDGQQVVQLYISDKAASVSTPIRRLAAFERVALKAGETRQVELVVSPEMMSIITEKPERIIEAGEFSISVGSGQPVAQTKAYIEGEFRVKGGKKIEL